MNGLMIAHIQIRRDAAGRYSLNDLHQAAGGEPRHQPAFWMRNAQTKALIGELGASADLQTPFATVNDGRNNGTYVVKELVYAYAMWISPHFHLQVIRAYDAMNREPAVQPSPRLDEVLNDPSAMRGLLLSYCEKVLDLQAANEAMQPSVQAFRRIAEADGSLSLREAAKLLQYPERRLAQWMHAQGWLFRGPRGGWMGYAEKTRAGYLTHKVTSYFDSQSQQEKISQQVRVTPEGLTRLAEKLSSDSLEEKRKFLLQRFPNGVVNPV